MNILRKNEKGFSAVEAILLILVIGLVVFVGYYAWHNQKNNNTSGTATTIQQSKSNAASSQAGTVNLTDATSFAKTFYTTYVKNVPVNNGQIDTVQKYGTNNLVFYYNYYQHGFDPIICSQNLPDSVTAKGISSSNGVANVDVSEQYGSAAPYVIHVQVVYRDSLKIDSVSCTGDAGNLPAPPPNN